MDNSFYIVSTPIGNIDDITLRAIQTLKNVDYIAAEDTREVGKLLKKLGIENKQLISYREQNHERAFPQILQLLRDGMSVALCSDRGTPTISDPGFRLIRELQDNDFQAVPIPGVSSVITALSASGIQSNRFTFLGFLPRTKGKQIKILEKFKDTNSSVVLFESPFRVIATLENILENFGDQIEVAFARELTKLYEEISRGNIRDIIEQLNKKSPRGEFVLIIKF